MSRGSGDVVGEVQGLPVDLPALIRGLAGQGATVAVAESLTGGLVTAALTSVAGSSAVVRGAVVAYHTTVKVDLLGVDPALLQRVGTVHPEVAEQMALGARRLLGTSHAIATTGEAGPEPASAAPVGTYFAAIAGPDGVEVVGGHAPGTRSDVRQAATTAALLLLTGVCPGPG